MNCLRPPVYSAKARTSRNKECEARAQGAGGAVINASAGCEMKFTGEIKRWRQRMFKTSGQ